MKATAKDLRVHSGDIFEAIRRGEEISLTYRGKIAAKIVPVKPKARARKMEPKHSQLFGIWKDHKQSEDIYAYIDKLRGPRYK